MGDKSLRFILLLLLSANGLHSAQQDLSFASAPPQRDPAKMIPINIFSNSVNHPTMDAFTDTQ